MMTDYKCLLENYHTLRIYLDVQEKKIVDYKAREEKNLQDIQTLKTDNDLLLQILNKLEDEKKVLKEKEKTFEDKIFYLMKKVTDFEKMLINERSMFEKERKVFETERKSYAVKSVEFSEFEKQIENERKEFVLKKNVFDKEKQEVEVKNVDFSQKIFEQEKKIENKMNMLSKKFKVEKISSEKEFTNERKNFEDERKMFKVEMKKLTRRLSELSTEVMKEQIKKSEMQKKVDFMMEERNSLHTKIKELEETQVKTVSSSSYTPISSFKSKDQIRSTNIFFDQNLDGSGSKRTRMIWKKKSVTHGKSNTKTNPPRHVYSINKLISLGHQMFDNRWYGTYSIPTPNVYDFKKVNIRGSINVWIPKSI